MLLPLAPSGTPLPRTARVRQPDQIGVNAPESVLARAGQLQSPLVVPPTVRMELPTFRCPRQQRAPPVSGLAHVQSGGIPRAGGALASVPVVPMPHSPDLANAATSGMSASVMPRRASTGSGRIALVAMQQPVVKGGGQRKISRAVAVTRLHTSVIRRNSVITVASESAKRAPLKEGCGGKHLPYRSLT